jgi:hypothetical protein
VARHHAAGFELTETLGEHPPGHTGYLRRKLDEALRSIEKADQDLG